MAKFIIDEEPHDIDIEGNFRYGKPEMLSVIGVDPIYEQPWYKDGYTVKDFLSEQEFIEMRSGIKDYLHQITGKNFDIEKYHQNCGDEHYKIVGKTRDLFPEDFNFNVQKIVVKLGELLGIQLTDIDPDTKKKLHIIVRINRPQSDDYNPPHKDIYQQYDETGVVPKCVNFWVPICGVNSKSTLPIAAGSHLIPENLILRSFDGGIVNGKKYNVRSVLKWDNSFNMIRPKIKDRQVLIFSSHLIHGCAANNQTDTTRISLEFRLFPNGQSHS